MVVKDHDGSNQKEIARACFLEAGSLTIILNKMEEKRLIERRILNGNRRSFHIFLTEEEAPKDKIFEAESKVIKELADKGNCVIIGRCSDYVLKNDSRVLKVFFTAPIESRIKRVMKRLDISYKDAQNKIRREDKMCADNYRYYTGRIWGAAANFDITINTDLGIPYIEKCIDDAL